MSWAGFCLDRFHVLEMSFLATKRGEGTELRIEAWGHPEPSETRETLLYQSAAADPEQRGIWGELGAEQLALGHREPAQESLKEAEQRDPQGAETMQLEALMAAAEKNWQEAGMRLSAIGARSPAELQRVLGSWPPVLAPGTEAAGAVWDCLRNPKTPCPLLKAPPQGGEGLSAKDLYAEGRWEQLKALAPAAATDASYALWRGMALARTGDCSQAIPSLERGLKTDQTTAGFWLQACYANEEARTEEQLIAAGNLVALHQLRGDVALRLRYDPAAAEKEYAEALKSRPQDPHLLASQAEAYKMLGDTAKARAAALAALAVNPRLGSALQTLAQMAMSERDYAEALTRLKQLAVLEPRNAWVQVEMGVAYGQLGHPAEAARFLSPQLAAGYPDKKGALHAQLASALRKLGREDEARQAAAEASRLANASLESGVQENSDAHQ
jgi:tetratricopeptide (TPR) repeat protein